MSEVDMTKFANADPGANIPIASVPNLRDLGGWPTRDGCAEDSSTGPQSSTSSRART
jgi:hypothetical protein